MSEVHLPRFIACNRCYGMVSTSSDRRQSRLRDKPQVHDLSKLVDTQSAACIGQPRASKVDWNKSTTLAVFRTGDRFDPRNLGSLFHQ